MEVERFWGRRFSPLACGFFVNRYIPLLGHIAVIYGFFGPQTQSVSSILYHQLRIFETNRYYSIGRVNPDVSSRSSGLYVLLYSILTYLLQICTHSVHSCTKLLTFHQILAGIIQVNVGGKQVAEGYPINYNTLQYDARCYSFASIPCVRHVSQEQKSPHIFDRIGIIFWYHSTDEPPEDISVVH